MLIATIKKIYINISKLERAIVKKNLKYEQYVLFNRVVLADMCELIYTEYVF